MSDAPKDIADAISARLDELEAVVGAATKGPWARRNKSVVSSYPITLGELLARPDAAELIANAPDELLGWWALQHSQAFSSVSGNSAKNGDPVLYNIWISLHQVTTNFDGNLSEALAWLNRKPEARVSLIANTPDWWTCEVSDGVSDISGCGPTPGVAVARCFLMTELVESRSAAETKEDGHEA